MINMVVSCEHQQVTLTKATHMAFPTYYKYQCRSGVVLRGGCMADCFRLHDSHLPLFDVAVIDAEHLDRKDRGG